MIQEIINFSNDLIKDIPDIMAWNIHPNEGIHISVELTTEGEWNNNDPQLGTDYAFYDGKTEPTGLLCEFSKLEIFGHRIGTTMNKVFDKKKQIFSCSPYILSFKKKSLSNEKLQGSGYEKIVNLFPFYFKNARQICLTDEKDVQLSKFYEHICIKVLQQIDKFTMPKCQKNGTIIQTPIFNDMKDDFFINIYLKNISIDKYREAHDNYLKQKLFNDNSYNNSNVITNETYGLSNFLNGLDLKKPFLKHKSATMYEGISGRITAQDVIALNNFEILISNGTLPNPLPIIIDREEVNKKIISLFNQDQESISYRLLLTNLFQQTNKKYLSDYYLINYVKTTKGIKINDFDFVPLFRFYLEQNSEIQNVTKAGIVKDKIFVLSQNNKIRSVFDFEQIIVKEIFNNSLVKIKDNKYSTYYFGDIDPNYVIGGDLMYQQIIKYRKAIYDFIYKSKNNAINTIMFDDMMYNSILTNIENDEIKERLEWNNTIKRKLNIWFSFYNMFNNVKNEMIMASKVTDLMSKMRSVAKGESNLETSEDFAFGAGQVVSYLIDRSIATNKTYAMLEPYLQKNKSNQLQDAIAQTITIYKHDINVYKGNFERLTSQVLTCDSNVDMKPLLKYFLAGCFCSCIIYESEKNQKNNNN